MATILGRAESSELSNVSAMLAGIEKSGGTSRASLARSLGLSRTTASTIVSRLLDTGLVVERTGAPGELPDGPGRPGIILDLAEDRWFALGAEFHSGHWAIAVTTLKGKIAFSLTRQVREGSPAAFLDALVAVIAEARRLAPGPLIPAIGVGAPGLVDCARGLVIRADDLGWRGVDISDRVRAACGLEAFVINRNRGSALAEARFGAGRGVHSLVYIGVGTGISAAFMTDGELLHGSSWSAGEIGHLVLEPEGPPCACGKKGCLQVLASGSAMAARAARLLASGRSSRLADLPSGGMRGEDVCAAAADGDEVAASCLEEAARHLGLAVANIITSFNPDKIILGGPVGQARGPFVAMVRREAARWAMEYPFAAASVEPGTLGEFSGALGAACLVLDRKLPLVLSARQARPAD